MGKSIKFFKKLTSLVLAGLTIFSSVPAKAWKEEDPRDAVNSKVNNMLKQGYHEITTNDLKDLTNSYDFIKCAYEVLDIFTLCSMICYIKDWNTTDVVSIDLSGVNLLFRNDKYILNLYEFGGKFCNLIKLKLDCGDKHLSILGRLATNFKKLKLIDLSRCRSCCVTHVEEGFIFNNYIDAYVKNNCIIKNEGFPEDFDMFEGSKNGISFICPCGHAVEFYKSVMGKHNTRHKIYDVNKLNVIRDKPIAIQCEKANKIDRKFVQENNGKYSKNILIPKNVNKIEKDAFKNAGLCGVTFEEGMTEIEFCDGCFAGCPLVKFELPKSLKKIVLGKNCFAGCPNELYIENYVRGEIERIEKEKEAEKQRVRDEVKKAASYIMDRQAKEKAAYLKKIKEENEQIIKKRKEEIKEAINVLEENKLKAVGAQEERQKDLDEKTKVDTSSMNEVEIKIFNSEKAMLEAKLDAANSNLELINTNLEGKNEILQELENGLKALEIKAKFEKLLADIERRETRLKKMLDEIKEKIKTAEGKEKSNKEEAERLATIAKEQAEKAAEQERIEKLQAEEQQRLDEEKKKLEEEKNKGFFTGLGEKISSLNPIKSVTDTLGNIGHKVVLGCKIALGVGATSVALIGVGLVAKTVTSVVNFFVSVKKLFTSKKAVHQKPSNSASNTSATSV